VDISASLGFNYNILIILKILWAVCGVTVNTFTEPVSGNETKQNGSFTMVNYALNSKTWIIS
jgi:hypothetical protein